MIPTFFQFLEYNGCQALEFRSILAKQVLGKQLLLPGLRKTVFFA